MVDTARKIGFGSKVHAAIAETSARLLLDLNEHSIHRPTKADVLQKMLGIEDRQMTDLFSFYVSLYDESGRNPLDPPHARDYLHHEAPIIPSDSLSRLPSSEDERRKKEYAKWTVLNAIINGNPPPETNLSQQRVQWSQIQERVLLNMQRMNGVRREHRERYAIQQLSQLEKRIFYSDSTNVPNWSITQITSALRKNLLNDAPANTRSEIKAGVLRATTVIAESEIIAEQVGLRPYQNYLRELKNFLDGNEPGKVSTEWWACPDGRIPLTSLGDLLNIHLHKRLGGVPDAQQTLSRDQDTYHHLRDRLSAHLTDPNNTVVAIRGFHFNSTRMTHGCGYETAKVGMEDYVKGAGIGEYLQEAGTSLDSLAPGRMQTFFVAHDIYSQGLAIGAPEAFHAIEENENSNFRDKLLAAHENGQICLTERLDDTYSNAIYMLANNIARGMKVPLDNKPEHFARNNILIGRVAMLLTRATERNGYDFLPDAVKTDVDLQSLRVLAYHALRNVTWRVLSNIIPGEHTYMHHEEQGIYFGPTGPDVLTQMFGKRHIGSQVTEQDFTDLNAIISLQQGFMTHRHETGAIPLFVTESVYPHEISNRLTFDGCIARLQQKEMQIKNYYKAMIDNGELIVIPLIMDPETRDILYLPDIH